MNRKLEKLAARLYDEGRRAKDAEQIKSDHNLSDEETEIVAGLLTYYEQLMNEEH